MSELLPHPYKMLATFLVAITLWCLVIAVMPGSVELRTVIGFLGGTVVGAGTVHYWLYRR